MSHIRTLVVLILAVGVAASSSAQQGGKTPRIGVLHAGNSKEAASVQREPFERGLRELGWVPGSSVVIDYRYGEGSPARLAESAVGLVHSGVDVIVARGPAAIRAARQATAIIPIVMSAGEDAVAEGFAKSLSRPGGNITGIDSLVFDLDAKRLELLKEAFPSISRVAVLGNPATEPTQFGTRMAALQNSAHALKLQVKVFEIRRAEDIAAAFDKIVGGQADALLVRGDPQVLDPHRATIVALAGRHRLPAIYAWRFHVEAGGLISYGTSLPGLHYRSATYVNRILKGAKPGDLSIETPTKFDLVVNVAAAKAQGFAVPPSLLFRADELIQ